MFQKESKIESRETVPLISIAIPEDYVGIEEVFYRTWLSTYPNEEIGITEDDIEDRFKNRSKPEVIKKRKERIGNPPSDEKFFVAKEDKIIVGVCRVSLKEDRNQLQAIYVLPEYQGRGIGKMLWSEAQKFFDPEKDIYVELAVYNKGALEFYKKLGFVDTGRRIKNDNFKMKSGVVIPEMEMVLKSGH